MSLTDEKRELRRTMRATLRAMSDDERADGSKAVCARLSALPELAAAKVVLSYSALPLECSPKALCDALAARGCTVAYPLCFDDGTFRAYAPREQMKPGMYGICEPDPERSELVEPDRIDVVIVPGMCFDDEARRMGKGAGYYDRYLAECAALKVGICFDCQLIDAVPCDLHDLAMDMVVTPSNVFVKKFRNP